MCLSSSKTSCRRERALLKSSCAGRIAAAQQSPPSKHSGFDTLLDFWCLFGLSIRHLRQRPVNISVNAKTEVYLTRASYQASTVLSLRALFAYPLLPSFLGPICALAVVVESMDSSHHAYCGFDCPQRTSSCWLHEGHLEQKPCGL